MKKHILALSAILLLAACSHTPKPRVTEAAPAAVPLPVVQPQPAVGPATIDPALVTAAQNNLRALGYGTGKGGDLADPAFQKAVIEFQKDQGLLQDGQVTQALVDRMKQIRAELPRPVQVGRDASFVYDDGRVGQAIGLLIAPPSGLSAEAPANFLQPLRPGTQGTYQWGRRAKDGSFTPATSVSCRAGRIANTNTALGPLDVIAVDCHGDGAQPVQWRSLYSPALGAVVRQERKDGVHNLIAVRPSTGGWPSAARTGLDWAVTHALETSGVPVQWSSTGVAPHFEIKAGAKIAGQEAGLTGKNAALSCRRFDMVQSQPALRYPGLACQQAGGWLLPGTAIRFAAPANGLAVKAPVGLRSAQK
jgi:peptidoglycan hydrolase-like protein with peptidoglycan-binding domain